MIYEKLKKLRQDNNKTTKEVANYLNMTVGNYNKIERGIVEISISMLYKLVEFYKINIVEILNNNNIENNDKDVHQKLIIEATSKFNSNLSIIINDLNIRLKNIEDQLKTLKSN